MEADATIGSQVDGGRHKVPSAMSAATASAAAAGVIVVGAAIEQSQFIGMPPPERRDTVRNCRASIVVLGCQGAGRALTPRPATCARRRSRSA